ncbi:hypothetical protein ACNJEF_21245, partial [Mycobacterium tuberculosis]
MATTRKKTGAVIGAAGATVVIVLAGMGGCSYVQNQNSGSNTSMSENQAQPSSPEEQRAPRKDPTHRDSEDKLDPSKDEERAMAAPD